MGKPIKGAVNAPLYIIGPHTVEWSYDMVNFHRADAESFGEYASRCFAASKEGGCHGAGKHKA